MSSPEIINLAEVVIPDPSYVQNDPTKPIWLTSEMIHCTCGSIQYGLTAYRGHWALVHILGLQ